MPLPRPNARIRVHLVHEDGDLLVVNKMPGVVSEPGRAHRDDSLLNGLLAHDGGRLALALLQLGEARDWGLLHRLDRLTSGLLVVAITANAWDALRADFEARRIRKRYLAIVRGELSDAGEIDAPLSERAEQGYRYAALDPRGGKPAVTRYRVLQRAGRYALVDCDLITGRLHQIRIHLASRGAVVAGDSLYDIGGAARPNAGRAKNPQLHLHAWSLGFTQPTTGEDRTFVAPLPRRFVEFAEAHGLHPSTG